MKKRYTKKQIQEAINYWQKQLKLGNYKKVLKESESFTTNIYGEMNLSGSYNGLEQWWLVKTNKPLNTSLIANAIKTIIEQFCNNDQYEFIDPKTGNIANETNLDYKHLATIFLKTGELRIQLSGIKGYVMITNASDEDINYCGDAYTII